MRIPERTVVTKINLEADVGRCRQYLKEAIICINNKYGFIKLTNLYQINDYTLYFSTKNVFCIDRILNWLPILQTLK